MKRFVFILFLASLVLPGMSQQHVNKREKKHTPSMSFLKVSPDENKKEREAVRFNFFETGTIAVKNNAHADSTLVYMNVDEKSDEMMFVGKEIPVYYEGTFRIKELETFYTDEFGEDYFPVEKSFATYNEDGQINRIEIHYWETDQWMPQYAMEMEMDEKGEEILYLEYNYNTATTEWELDYGYRAVDKSNENDLLAIRTWEYYNSFDQVWAPEAKEEFFYNEEDGLIEMIYYWYEELDKSWEVESREVFEMDENNTWTSGYSYEWDDFEEEWLYVLKYSDFEWFNFELMQFTGLTVMVNPAVFGDWELDVKDNNEEEIDWMNFIKMNAKYADNGMMTLMKQELYYDDLGEWVPVFQTDWAYDHFDNIIYEAYSEYNGEEWEIIEGIKVEMDYNEDLSIKLIDVYMVEQQWKNVFSPVMRFEYFYTDETTTVPSLVTQQALKVYPNPCSSGINIVWSGRDEVVDISIVTMDGKIIASYDQFPVVNGQLVLIDVSNLPNGLYFIRSQGKINQQVARFVKK